MLVRSQQRESRSRLISHKFSALVRKSLDEVRRASVERFILWFLWSFNAKSKFFNRRELLFGPARFILSSQISQERERVSVFIALRRANVTSFPNYPKSERKSRINLFSLIQSWEKFGDALRGGSSWINFSARAFFFEENWISRCHRRRRAPAPLGELNYSLPHSESSNETQAENVYFHFSQLLNRLNMLMKSCKSRAWNRFSHTKNREQQKFTAQFHLMLGSLLTSPPAADFMSLDVVKLWFTLDSFSDCFSLCANVKFPFVISFRHFISELELIFHSLTVAHTLLLHSRRERAKRMCENIALVASRENMTTTRWDARLVCFMWRDFPSFARDSMHTLVAVFVFVFFMFITNTLSTTSLFRLQNFHHWRLLWFKTFFCAFLYFLFHADLRISIVCSQRRDVIAKTRGKFIQLFFFLLLSTRRRRRSICFLFHNLGQARAPPPHPLSYEYEWNSTCMFTTFCRVHSSNSARLDIQNAKKNLVGGESNYGIS